MPPTSSSKTSPTITMAVLAAAALAFALLQSAVSPALATIQKDLHTTETGAAWMLTAYLLSAAVCTPILGRLGDIHGKRKMLFVSLAGLGVGSALAAVSTSIGMLIVARAIQGLGGGIFPLAYGLIRDSFPRERVAGSIGMISALLGLGSGIAVVLAGLIIQHLSWHWLFWVPCVVIVIALFGTWRFIEEAGQRAPGKINWTGAVLLSIGLTALLLALSETGTWGWGSPKTLGLVLVGIVALVAWVRNEKGADSPLVDMEVMKLRGVWTTNVVAFTLGAGMFVAFVLLPQFAQTPSSHGFGFGYDVIGAGLLLVPMSLCMLGVGFISGPVEARVGSRVAAIGGMVSMMITFIILLASHATPLPLYIASGFVGIGLGFGYAAMANLIVQAVPVTQTGVATGMNSVARTVGAAFGAQLAATFLTSSVAADGLPEFSGYREAYLFGLVAVAVGLVATLMHPGARATEPARAVVPVAETA